MQNVPGKEMSEDQIQNIRERFDAFDVTKAGHISTSTLPELMLTFGHRLPRDELTCLERELDPEGSGIIQVDVFVPVYVTMIKSNQERLFYKDVFRMLDKKKTGAIKCGDLIDILKGLAKEVDLTEDEVEEMVNETDEDGNGEISFEEFFKLMTTE